MQLDRDMHSMKFDTHVIDVDVIVYGVVFEFPINQKFDEMRCNLNDECIWNN